MCLVYAEGQLGIDICYDNDILRRSSAHHVSKHVSGLLVTRSINLLIRTGAGSRSQDFCDNGKRSTEDKTEHQKRSKSISILSLSNEVGPMLRSGLVRMGLPGSYHSHLINVSIVYNAQ